MIQSNIDHCCITKAAKGNIISLIGSADGNLNGQQQQSHQYGAIGYSSSGVAWNIAIGDYLISRYLLSPRYRKVISFLLDTSASDVLSSMQGYLGQDFPEEKLCFIDGYPFLDDNLLSSLSSKNDLRTQLFQELSSIIGESAAHGCITEIPEQESEDNQKLGVVLIIHSFSELIFSVGANVSFELITEITQRFPLLTLVLIVHQSLHDTFQLTRIQQLCNVNLIVEESNMSGDGAALTRIHFSQQSNKDSEYQLNHVLCEVRLIRRSMVTGKLTDDVVDLFTGDIRRNIIALKPIVKSTSKSSQQPQHLTSLEEEKEREEGNRKQDLIGRYLKDSSSSTSVDDSNSNNNNSSSNSNDNNNNSMMKRLITFDSTDPEFDDDEDLDDDLDL